MTALERYLRLEAIALWREHPGAAPREVIASLGTTTLMLRDLHERPLGHWALAGIAAVGREGGATVYAMTLDGAETLAIRDRDMVAALAVLSQADRLPPPRQPPQPRRRWRPLAALAALALLAAGAAWAPGALRERAARALTPERAAELGDRMLIVLIAERGAPCAAAEGRRALQRLAAALAPASPPELAVMDLGTAPALALPGGRVLIDRTALAAARSPAEVAGWVAAARARAPESALMRDAGPAAPITLIATGALGEAALARAAAAALSAPLPVASPPAARLSAADWAALRAICG